jgi:hypothetical protein
MPLPRLRGRVAADMEEREITYRQHPAYLARECGGASRASVVGAWPGSSGMRWFHGPICVERYTGDDDPEPPRDGQRRLLVWQTMRRTDLPKGWWRGFPKMSIGLTGYAPITDPDAERGWSSHARRHLARWRRDPTWSVREIGPDEYLAAYARSTQDLVLRVMFGAILKEKLRTHPGLTRILGASRDGRPIEAGFVCVDVPETAESTHLMSFIVPTARDTSAAVGLMDAWFRASRERGFRWADLGLFWQKGDPRDWKGFSRFKAQFGTRYLRYPTPLMRLDGGRAPLRR